MQIFVINLKLRTDRKEHIVKELTSKNIDYKIVEAINGWDLAKKDYKFSSYMSRGEMGCYISHFKSIEQITDEFGIILEDDIAIESLDFYEDIKKLKENLPADWDICFLGSTPLYNTKYKDKIGNVIKINGYCEKVNGKHYGTGGYMIKKSTIDKIQMSPLKAPIDIAFYAFGLNQYLANPPLVRHLPRMKSNTQRPV